MLRVTFGCVLLFLMTRVGLGKEEIPSNVVAGKPVEADATLKVGDKLVGVWDKKNYFVEVIEIKKDKQVRIHWVGFDKNEDIDVPPSTLYRIGDTTPTRKIRTSPLPKEYQALDKNGDGQIGLYEWDRGKYAEFKKLDKNHDGFLTPQELGSKNGGTGVASTGGSGKENKEPKPNPGNLFSYNNKINETMTFTVTGKIGGNVWGTGTYTNDSDLASAAVHSGVLKDGETKAVTVTIVMSPETFAGSSANGVTSSDWPQAFPAAYTVK